MRYEFLDNWEINGLEKPKAKIMIDIYRYELFNTLDDSDFICKMLEKYTFCSVKRLEGVVKKLLNFISCYKTGEEYSLCAFLPINDTVYHNSDCLARIFRKIDSSFKINISFNVDILPQFKNFIIIDDFSGTGTTITDFIRNLDVHISGCSVFVCPLFYTKEAKLNIEKSFENKKNNYSFLEEFSNEIETKFVTEKNIFDKKQLNSFNEISSEYVNNDVVFGYDKSEALFSNYYFTPNNTYGIFWSTKIKVPLFSRKTELHEYANSTIEENMKIIKDVNLLIKKTSCPKYSKKSFVFALLFLFGFSKNTICKMIKIDENTFDIYYEKCQKNGYISANGEEGSNLLNFIPKKEYFFYKNFRTVITESDKQISELYDLK